MQYFIWDVNPVLLQLGPLTIHWYGALFAAAIFAGLQVVTWIYKNENKATEPLDVLLMYVVVGIIVGARLGHCFFYDPSYYLANPMKIFAIWEGGLASHGGGLGVIIAVSLYVKRHTVDLLWLLDRLAIGTAIFGVFVRSANFVNSEIIGKQTDVAWAIIFKAVDNVPRHPAQLYEAFAYLAIFLVLMALYKRKAAQTPKGLILGVFLLLTFTARFLIEMVKTKQAAYDAGTLLNTGQLLSIPFFIAGIALVAYAIKKPSFPALEHSKASQSKTQKGRK